MESQVAFYRLSRKVVNDREHIPDEARQVMYYSLAIGHHVGVMDCFSEMMAVPAQDYRSLVERMPEGEPRRKLEGVLKWHEIEINRGHSDQLLPALKDLLDAASNAEARWLRSMIGCLQEMQAEPALYMMVRMRS